MPEFPPGVSVPTWINVIIGDGFNTPIISDGGRTYTVPSAADPAHPNGDYLYSWTDEYLPLHPDGNPVSFELRFAFAFGIGNVGFELHLTDNEERCPSNAGVTLIGGAFPLTGAVPDAWLSPRIYCLHSGSYLPQTEPRYSLLPAVDNSAGPTAPIAVTLGWEYPTRTMYRIYNGVRTDYIGPDDWLGNPDAAVYVGISGAYRQYRVHLLGLNGNSPPDPFSDFAEQLTGIEMEIFAAAAPLAVRGVDIEVCGAGVCP